MRIPLGAGSGNTDFNKGWAITKSTTGVKRLILKLWKMAVLNRVLLVTGKLYH
jgi:hypothetical protein